MLYSTIAQRRGGQGGQALSPPSFSVLLILYSDKNEFYRAKTFHPAFQARPVNPDQNKVPHAPWFLLKKFSGDYRFIFNSERSGTISLNSVSRQTIRFILNYSQP